MNVTDPLFGPTRSPFPVGEGPFRQKGNGYLGDFTYFDREVRGGTKAVLAAIADPRLREFLSQTFRGSEWYDAFPCVELHAAAARLRGVSFSDHRRAVGEFHAREAGGGIYRALLRFVSNENVAVWGPRVSSIYFEFGKTETRAVADKEVHGMRRGLPAGLVQFVMFASRGFCEETLRMAGAKSPSLEIGAVDPEETAHGQQLYKAGLTIRWT